jgi:hypothetical protein
MSTAEHCGIISEGKFQGHQKSARYGTPEMAREVIRLLEDEGHPKSGVFIMLGHEEGIVAFGRSAEEAGDALLSSLSRYQDCISKKG